MGVPQREWAHYYHWASNDDEGRVPFDFAWQHYDEEGGTGYRPAPTLRRTHVQAIRTTWEGAPRPARFFDHGREFTDVVEAVLDLCHELRRRGGTHAQAYRDFLRAICLSD